MPATDARSAAGPTLVLANGLKWLAPEIDASLHRARVVIDHQQEDDVTEFDVSLVLAELKLVLGALRMANCHGGAILAEELCATLEAVASSQLPEPAAALAAVSGATLQLSDYLNALRHSAADRAAVLQPAISELRLASGRIAATEADLFVRQMQLIKPVLPTPSSSSAAAGQIIAAKLLPAFQTLLLQWLKGIDVANTLLKLRKVGDHLASHAQRADIALLWSAFAAALDSLVTAPGTESLELKRWIGRMGLQIKTLADHGEAKAAETATETTWRLLAHAASIYYGGSRWLALRHYLPLDTTLPVEPALSAARQHLRGPNTRLLEKVAEEVRADLALVKDGLDLALRAGGLSIEAQFSTAERLTSIANTLLLLGLPQLQQVVRNQSGKLAGLGAGGNDNQGQWMRIATALLRVEHSLETTLFRPLRQIKLEPQRELPNELIEAVPHSQDLNEGVSVLLREMLVNVAKLKAQLDAFLKGAALRDAHEPLQFLSEVGAGLVILDRLPAAELAAQLGHWLQHTGPAALRSDTALAVGFSEAVAALEMYLEALRDALPQPEHILEILAAALPAIAPQVAVAVVPTARFLQPMQAPEPAPLLLPGTTLVAAAEPAAVELATAAAAPAFAALSAPLETPTPTAFELGAEPVSAPITAHLEPTPALAADDDDPEIRDIFIEEAEEVLDALKRQLPLLHRDPTEPAVQADIRRAFHTLKGSGRMVGANRIAELGWAIEHLLNRCIEATLPVNAAVVRVIAGAVQQLPLLLTEFAARSAVSTDDQAQGLIARAHFLASGRAPEMVDLEVLEVFRADALDRLADVERWLAEPSQIGIDADAVRALHTIKGSAAVVNAEPLSQLAGALESVLKKLVAADASAPPEVRALFAEALPALRNWTLRAGQVLPPDAVDWLARVDAIKAFLPSPSETKSYARRDALVNLAFDRLQIVEERLLNWTAAPAELALALAMADAAEGLMAVSQDCVPLARVAKAMAERLRASDLATQAPDVGFFLALANALEQSYQLLDAHREGSGRESGRELAEQLRELPLLVMPLASADLLNSGVVADAVTDDDSTAVEAIADALAAAPNVVSATEDSGFELYIIPHQVPVPPEIINHELASLLVDEAHELLAVLKSDTPSWQPPAPVPANLYHALQTLTGSARMAGYPALGDLAHSFAHRLSGLAPDGGSTTALRAELLATLPVFEQAINSFAQMILQQVSAPAATATEPPQLELSAVLAVESAEISFNLELGLETAPIAAIASFANDSPQPADDFVRTLAEEGRSTGSLLNDGNADEYPGDAAYDLLPAPEVALALSTTLQPLLQPLPSLLEGMEQIWPDIRGAALGAPVQRARVSTKAIEYLIAANVNEAIDPELANIFIAEASEALETIDTALTDWLRDASDPSAIGELQRALHTLKGGARMAGFMQMADASHEMESRVVDLLAPSYTPTANDHAALKANLETLERMHDALSRGHYAEAVRVAEPLHQAFTTGNGDSEVDFQILRAERPPPLVTAAIEVPAGWAAELFWRPDEDATAAASRRELARVPVEKLDAMLNEAGEISIYCSRLEQRNAELVTQLSEMSRTIVRLREQLRYMDVETDAQIVARGLNAPGTDATPDRYAQDFDPLEMDRYSRMQELSRALNESVGDLGSLHLSMDQGVNETQSLLLQQGRINAGVQQGLMSTLMVPFSRQVARLQRVVRQTAQEQGKFADLHFVGVESELDRNVLERMTAPLEHLLRNAVVHGLEDPQGRSNANKLPLGQITVSLKREGTQLLMEISDDGRGLDLPAIRSKAIERGLLPEGAELGDDEIARFIFEPGFSTTASLTQTAGRGVGMDVVAAEVKQLSGSLELHSEPGRGTSFIVRLPLSLALSQALMVTVADETYALPLATIEGIGRIPRSVAVTVAGNGDGLFTYGDHDYRVRYLAELIDLPQTVPADVRTVPAVLVRLVEGIAGGERRVALIVDGLMGNREVVSKAVGPQLSSIAGVAGATILPSGEVVLILDPTDLLIDRARHRLIAEAAASRATLQPQTGQSGRLIMVVDDSVTMRRVAERLLQRSGYRVITAKDGLDAIAQLQNEAPAAILLDIEMPRADGFEVASFVRNNERIQETPIIMITSRSGDKHRARAAALGVNRYLIKPYQEEQLLHELRVLLQAREAEAA